MINGQLNYGKRKPLFIHFEIRIGATFELALSWSKETKNQWRIEDAHLKVLLLLTCKLHNYYNI